MLGALGVFWWGYQDDILRGLPTIASGPYNTDLFAAKNLPFLIGVLVENAAARDTLKTALARWHSPDAAQQIAEIVLRAVGRSAASQVRDTARAVGCDGCEPTPNPPKERSRYSEGSRRRCATQPFPSWEG